MGPTSSGNCPNMPAGCMCRASSELSLLEEEEDSGISSIICRMRTAITLAKAKFPKELKKFKASKSITENKKSLEPLLSCLQNAKADCSSQVSNVMSCFSCMGVLPDVQKLQHKMGRSYQKLAAKC